MTSFNNLIIKGIIEYKPVKENGKIKEVISLDKFYNNEKVVAIWKKHGFYWGGDWSNRTDPMHFTYTGS